MGAVRSWLLVWSTRVLAVDFGGANNEVDVCGLTID